jgi:hypothetical protein
MMEQAMAVVLARGANRKNQELTYLYKMRHPPGNTFFEPEVLERLAPPNTNAAVATV